MNYIKIGESIKTTRHLFCYLSLLPVANKFNPITITINDIIDDINLDKNNGDIIRVSPNKNIKIFNKPNLK